MPHELVDNVCNIIIAIASAGTFIIVAAVLCEAVIQRRRMKKAKKNLSESIDRLIKEFAKRKQEEAEVNNDGCEDNH